MRYSMAALASEIEELCRRGEAVDALRRHFPLVGEMQLVFPDGFRSELIWRNAEILRVFGYIVNIGALRFR
jgi:hypothetical protein